MCLTHGHVSTLIASITVLLTAIYIYENERNMLKLKEEVNRIADVERNMIKLKEEVNRIADVERNMLKLKEEVNRIADVERNMLKLKEEVNRIADVEGNMLKLKEEVNRIADMERNMIKLKEEVNRIADMERNMLKLKEEVNRIADVERNMLKLKEEIKHTNSNLMKMKMNENTRPIFSAVFKVTHGFKLLGNEEVLKFDVVYLNRGSGYDPSTGYFTAPLSGIYLVTTTVAPYESNLHCHLCHNSKIVGLIYGGGWNTGSLQISLNVVKGDRLFIKHAIGAPIERIQITASSTFSAVYISE